MLYYTNLFVDIVSQTHPLDMNLTQFVFVVCVFTFVFLYPDTSYQVYSWWWFLKYSTDDHAYNAQPCSDDYIFVDQWYVWHVQSDCGCIS